MPFNRPTLSQIIDRIKADITTRMGSQASVLRRAWTTIFARALGGAVHLLYGFIAWAVNQFFGDTAEREALIQKAGVYGLTLKPAEYAQGYIRITGTNGTVIPVGTAWKRSDGFRYVSDVLTSISGAYSDVHVRADQPGVSGNLPEGQAVSLESPLTGVSNNAVVSPHASPGDIQSGSDEEDIEAFRARYLSRVRNPPQGGAKEDYRSWSLEIAGVGDAFVYGPKEILGEDDHPVPVGGSIAPPLGQVWVYIKSTDPLNPTPAGSIVNAVQTYLGQKKEVTATVQVFGVVPRSINFAINVGLTAGFSLADAENQIRAELADLMIREATPFRTLRLSQFDEVISNAQAEAFHTLTSPSADVALAYNEIGVVGTVTLTQVT